MSEDDRERIYRRLDSRHYPRHRGDGLRAAGTSTSPFPPKRSGSRVLTSLGFRGWTQPESDPNLRGRDFLAEQDFTASEFNSLIDLAQHSRPSVRPVPSGSGWLVAASPSSSRRPPRAPASRSRQRSPSRGLLHGAGFQHQSDRHKESIADTARVLSRVYDGIEYRGSDHTIVEQLAEYADVPVFNGLTDTWHPTQMLADFLTMREHSTQVPPVSFPMPTWVTPVSTWATHCW